MENINIIKMDRTAIKDAVELITAAMNKDEGDWAKSTMEFHFSSLKEGMDDGREYYLWWKDNKAKGIVGLHRYIWGPPENVWLAWFAVSPELQGNGYGIKLLNSMFIKAQNIGYKKFFVETYNHQDFEKAIRFYKKFGFSEAGTINNYLPDGSEMLVLFKAII